MAIITGMRRELSMIGILLVVCSIILTGVKAENNTTITEISVKTASTAASLLVTSTAASIAPASATSTAATTSAVPATSTQTTKPTPAHSPSSSTAPSGRKFDAASFIGGIILGIVSVVLVSIGYKWYQNRRKSYHSL